MAYPVKPLPPEKLEIIAGYFKGLNANRLSVYESGTPEVKVMDKREVIKGGGWRIKG